METYEAKGIVTVIQGLLRRHAQKRATAEDTAQLIEWEARAEAMLRDPDVIADLRIITNEHQCDNNPERNGFIPSTADEQARCEAWATEHSGYRYPVNPFADPRHFRREPVERVGVREAEKVIDRRDFPLQKIKVKHFTAISGAYQTPRGTEGRDSCSSSPEVFTLADGQIVPLGASSALLSRLLEAKAEGAA